MGSLWLTLSVGLLLCPEGARAEVDKPPTTPDLGLPPPGSPGPGSPAPVPEKRPKPSEAPPAQSKDQKPVDK
jgi:hypothetical protein